MKILILGAQGRLGQTLTYELQENHEVIPFSRFNTDICNYEQTKVSIENIKPDCIINAAAITETSDNEKKKDEIFQSNTAGTVNLALIAKENNISFIQISCSSVLAGNTQKNEAAEMKPLDIIGESKAEAETRLQEIFPKDYPYLILRTGILFGEYGHSVVNKFKHILKKQKSVEVVNDILQSFTSTQLEADCIQKFLEKDIWDEKILHCCHPEKISYGDLMEMTAEILGKEIEIKKVSAKKVGEIAGDFSLEASEEGKSLREGLEKIL